MSCSQISRRIGGVAVSITSKHPFVAAEYSPSPSFPTGLWTPVPALLATVARAKVLLNAGTSSTRDLEDSFIVFIKKCSVVGR